MWACARAYTTMTARYLVINTEALLNTAYMYSWNGIWLCVRNLEVWNILLASTVADTVAAS